MLKIDLIVIFKLKLTTQIITILNHPAACSTAGFTYGFVTDMNRNFKNETLTQLFGASISGLICSIGADLLDL
uniref:Uncharacterized protein n=1 Tax=Marseillevirus LCMAC201 TaxID=2506605 RepID=A0A481YVV2_9VIRU|nr:MAG: hypothetical protein LCMAC201_00520 [Marseillevirus LCMAC201]